MIKQKNKRWVVTDDSGYHDCVIGRFVEKNKAIAFIKERMADPKWRDDKIHLFDNKTQERWTYYATKEQHEEKRLYQEAEDARLEQIIADRKCDAESGFHWRDGWFFKRQEDGSVRVLHLDEHKNVKTQIIIPENEWASIVTSVSAEGETAERWEQSRRFHGCQLPTAPY